MRGEWIARGGLEDADNLRTTRSTNQNFSKKPETMKLLKSLTLALAAMTLLFQAPITLGGDDGRRAEDSRKAEHNLRQIRFEKCWVPGDEAFGGHFEGQVSGAFGAGTVVFRYFAVLPESRNVRFSGEYTITTPDGTFTTVCAGSLDTRSGEIVLNGVVTSGPSLGDLVRVRARLNEAGTCSSGTMTFRPAEGR